MKTDILGVKIDDVNIAEALEMVESWIWNPGKHYIVTPNLEFILAAQKDPKFKEILNQADLALPDSSSLGFSLWLLSKNKFIRLLLWPLFFVPLKQLIPFDRVAGTDLVEALCKVAAEKGFTTGFLGGKSEVAKDCAECLQKKYPKLKVVFAESGGEIDKDGKEVHNMKYVVYREKEKNNTSPHTIYNIPPTDLLFVAFGHIKQEKWIANNLDKLPVHVSMGVGGAFDYLSGNIWRAPAWIRSLGFEWLFRLIVQPLRIKRQLSLIKYLWLILTK